MGPWSSRLAGQFIDFVEVQDGERVLDMGSGTGSLAMALAAVTSSTEIVAIDPSKQYIQFARKRSGNSRVRFHVGDAMNLPYPDGYFDKCLAQLMISFVPDAHRVIAEMHRVTKAGGTIAACLWASGRSNQRSWTFWEAAKAVDSTVKQQRKKKGGYGTSGRLSSLWAECGLKAVEEVELVVSIDFASFEDYWRPYLNGQGRAVAYLKGLTADSRDKLRARLRRIILGTRPNGHFSIQAQALSVRGIC